MQYQVPQFVDIEDRIIGPLTLKQFLYLAFAGALLFVFWFLFNFYIWIILAIPISALAAAFAFLKINDRPFVYFFLAFIKYFTNPKLYIFSAAPKRSAQRTCIPKKEEVEIPQPQEKKKADSFKIKRVGIKFRYRRQKH